MQQEIIDLHMACRARPRTDQRAWVQRRGWAIVLAFAGDDRIAVMPESWALQIIPGEANPVWPTLLQKRAMNGLRLKSGSW